MKTLPKPEILDTERMSSGVLVTFKDGISAIYSAALLYAALDQAEVFEDVDEG